MNNFNALKAAGICLGSAGGSLIAVAPFATFWLFAAGLCLIFYKEPTH